MGYHDSDETINPDRVVRVLVWGFQGDLRREIRRQMGQYGGSVPKVIFGCQCAACANADDPWLEKGTSSARKGGRNVTKHWTKLHVPKEWYDNVLARVMEELAGEE